jgi:hypothetical protein
MKGKSNKKLEKSKGKLFTSSFTIAIPITNFTNVIKEIEIKKMEMKKFVTFQMLQNKKMKKNDDTKIINYSSDN